MPFDRQGSALPPKKRTKLISVPVDGGGAFVAFVSLFDVWRARVRHVQLLQGRVRPSHVGWRAAARREAWLWLIAEARKKPRRSGG